MGAYDPAVTATRSLLIGTAGHIDHGKSSLVRALTGVDPDRLPEERARGMTIDLGFAHRRHDDCDLYFVDVPGHERFIRNMVAGAAGIDVALLVVAANDSVMPQTREHVEVLSLLGVTRVVVAISKVDLVDPEWADVVESDVAGVLAEFGLTARAFVRVSSVRGDGLDALLAALRCLAQSPSPVASAAWFRMPIDRAFSVAGRGTVVTGSVLHGHVQQNEELDLLPTRRRVRVRDLQTHQEALDAAGGRLRLAINLPNVEREEVSRGMELATPGYLTPTKVILVQLSSLRQPGRAQRTRARLRLHLGALETTAECNWSAPPGAVIEGLATIRTTAPVTAVAGQRFVLRDESGQRTLGGGIVLDPLVASARIPVDFVAPAEDAAPAERLLHVLARSGWCGHRPEQLAARAGLPDGGAVAALLDQLAREERICTFRGGDATIHLHRTTYDNAADAAVAAIRNHLQANPRLVGILRVELGSWMPRACPAPLRNAFAERLLQEGKLRARGEYIAPAGAEAALPPADRILYEELVAAVRHAGLNASALTALPCATARNLSRLGQLAEMAGANGELRKIAPGLWLHREAWDEAVQRVTQHLSTHGGQTVAALRDLLGSSRKTVVPLLEALDRANITRRQGDLRTLR